MDVNKIIDFIAEEFYCVDVKLRNRLSLGYIKSERDYVSKLTGFWQLPFGLDDESPWHMIYGGDEITWFATDADGSSERAIGFDGITIFDIANEVKVGLFEAKWPRILINPTYRWDDKQNDKPSHFSDQIRRQSSWSDNAAIWEMFFNEHPVNTRMYPFDTLGSTCIKHIHAYNFINQTPPDAHWRNEDLIKLATLVAATPESLNIKYIITEILSCRFGKRLPIVGDYFDLLDNEGGERISVPIPNLETGNTLTQSNERIQIFMKEYGLSTYQYVKINGDHQWQDLKALD